MKQLAHAFVPVLVSVLLAHGGVAAQEKPIGVSFTAQPTSYSLEGRPYQVTGYGNAKFGMTAEQVAALVKAERPNEFKTLKDDFDVIQRTRVLTIVIPQLAPGPGPANVSYVFGASSQRLIAINVVWQAVSQATSVQQTLLSAAASVLTGDLIGYQWPPLNAARGHVLAPGALVVFSGMDEAGGGIQVRLDGVSYDLEKRQTGAPLSTVEGRYEAPPGPAQLRFSMVANVEQPDIFRISPGAF